MLKKFAAENFKAFSERIELDLGSPGSYEFNAEAVNGEEGIISKAIIYGFNGCGKSVLGLALFDIIIHLTDKEKGLNDYAPYLNLNSSEGSSAKFEYTFMFEGTEVQYSYEKANPEELQKEELKIGGRTVLEYDFRNHKGYSLLEGSQTLKLSSPDSQISRVKYVSSNAILESNHENEVFRHFMLFIENMLMFYSLEANRYRGFRTDSEKIASGIIQAGKTKEFESYLRANNVDIELDEREVDGENILLAKYGRKAVNFYTVASRGTKSLALFYYWMLQMERSSFVYMDEFDAFYHFELSENIVQMLKYYKGTQIILTTHNTDLLSNDILRPDCYFWLYKGKIRALNQLTDKELRKAHNLQKMFKAGTFQ